MQIIVQKNCKIGNIRNLSFYKEFGAMTKKNPLYKFIKFKKFDTEIFSPIHF